MRRGGLVRSNQCEAMGRDKARIGGHGRGRAGVDREDQTQMSMSEFQLTFWKLTTKLDAMHRYQYHSAAQTLYTRTIEILK